MLDRLKTFMRPGAETGEAKPGPNAGVGAVGVAAAITSQLTKKDFRADNYGNHFVKVGDYWVNTEYFTSISPNIAACSPCSRPAATISAPASTAAGTPHSGPANSGSNQRLLLPPISLT